MDGILLDYSDIADIFKEKLHVNNMVKSISSIFLNPRYAAKINYKPYFQRNYVWDAEKASYFIESILLGTEIPPLVFFQTKANNEVIDGRQRYETIERFLNDRFALNEAGLHSLKAFSGKKYSQLSEEIHEQFEETRIRILQFKVVNEPRLDDEREDKIKKEIFRRYNSGITPLGKAEIERASYIKDPVSKYFTSRISEDNDLFQHLCKFFLPISKQRTTTSKRDKINYLLMQIRTLLVISEIPLYSYASSSSRQEVIKRYYTLQIKNMDPAEQFLHFKKIIDLLCVLEGALKKRKCFLADSKLFFESAYWGVDILLKNKADLTPESMCMLADAIVDHNKQDVYWERILNNPSRELSVLFDPTGSHYYSSTTNRYNFVANLFGEKCYLDFSQYLKNPEKFKMVMSLQPEVEELQHYRLNKPLPETLTIDDIISDMKKNRFLIRPEYQRSEVKNLQKASYLMESILLGINIPPIFIYKRFDKVKEVVDGQQRLLAILGFLGETYKDENGVLASSNKDKFKLSKLRILDQLNGKNIDSISEKFIDKIYEFPIDVIEIDHDLNPDFSQTDLFARLNTKPYPITVNTFEMWNAYVDKEIILKIREIANIYEGKIFRAKDTRMKVEELITSLAYLDYRLKNTDVDLRQILNVYKKNDKLCARITSKETVTSTLSDVSNKNKEAFISAIATVEEFAKKVECLIDDNPVKLKELFSHSRKGTQYKTDQNYYFLWTMLRRLSLKDISDNKQTVFREAANMFSQIQHSPESYTTDDFFDDISSFCKEISETKSLCC